MAANLLWRKSTKLLLKKVINDEVNPFRGLQGHMHAESQGANCTTLSTLTRRTGGALPCS